MNEFTLIEISGITIRVPGLDLLPSTSLSIKKGENYLVTGENGSGKTSLMKVITGEIPVCRGSVKRYHSLPLSKNVSYLSFENLKKIIRKENLIEEAEYYSGRSMKKEAFFHLDNSDSSYFDKEKLADKKISHLSSGELRKFQILKLLDNKPEILILDEPFDGLDEKSKKILKELIVEIGKSEIALFLVTHRCGEIPELNLRHINIENNIVNYYTSYSKPEDNDFLFPSLNEFENDLIFNPNEILVELKDCSVSYMDKIIFSDLNLLIKRGDKWVIQGENGCGKSTLLGLITGDHLQSYSNFVKIFGMERGKGESIWEIKKNIGHISPGIHLRYDKNIEAFKVVLSGFYDSIGLYKKPGLGKIKIVDYIFDKFKINHLYKKNFNSLSYGQQRIILILRALIKDPDLIIMDEPCHGLDEYHRGLVLEMVRTISRLKNKTLIYVSHSDSEIRFDFSHVLRFEKKDDNGFYGKIITKQPN